MKTTTKRMPCFVAYGADGYITAMFQPSVCDRPNYRMVHGIARSECEPGGRVEVIAVDD